MGTGNLIIQAMTAGDSLPIANAHVEIDRPDGTFLYETDSDANGNTNYIPLTAPDVQYTLDSNFTEPAYSVADVVVSAEGFVTDHIHGVEIVDTQRTILPVHMLPLTDAPDHMTDRHIYLSPPGLLSTARYRKVDPPEMRLPSGVVIPDFITVHLGAPTDASARNVRVPFPEYIKNVASSEIYSTWPYNSLVSNIHAIVTYALNRIFTEWYRSRGYNFDITNSTAFDQHYREGGPIFENINEIVDGIFNVYARRMGFGNPFFTQYCNGTTVTCPGLSQWGTVTLAEQGLTPLEILRYYYPNDLELITNNNITAITESYPGYSLSPGSQGDAVRRMQTYLNRIRVNYPLIPLISNPTGSFDTETHNAVRTFQRTFHLTDDGIIGRSTWNRITAIYVGITRLAELGSEGVRISIGENPPDVVLSLGARSENVLEMQFILNVISEYYDTVPPTIKDSVFDAETEDSVIAFQRTFGLTPDGVVGPATWDALYSVYRGIAENVYVSSVDTPTAVTPAYPGTLLKIGSTGSNVELMQNYLNTIRIVYPSIPYLMVDGIFGNAMQNAIIAFQQQFLLTPDGIIGPITWNKIAEEYQMYS